jgi:hypothetical protein
MKKPKVYAHASYVGTTGYNNHTRDFFRELSKHIDLKVRNFTIGNGWGSIYTGFPSPPTTLQELFDFCNNRELSEEDLEWLEWNIPFNIDIYEQLQKVESKLDKPFSPVVQRKIRKLKLDRIK